MKRRIVGFLCLWFAAVVIAGGGLLAWKSKRDAERLRRLDAEVVAEVEAAIIAHLTALPPENPITQRYGAFEALEGAGYTRNQGFKLGPSLSLDRRAHFEKAEVRCPIRIGQSQALKINIFMSPSPKWMEKTPDASLVRSGNEFKMIRPGVEGSTSLEIGVGHPRFAYDARDLRRQQQRAKDVDRIFHRLVVGVSDEDPERTDEAFEALQAARSPELLQGVLARVFAHPDPAVRAELIDCLTPQPTQDGLWLGPSTRSLLLEKMADPDQPIDLRRTLVDLLLHSQGDDRRSLYEQLAEMGTEGHFAIAPLAAFVANRDEIHWRAAAEAPVEAVELLGSWGPASAEAVPALIDALQEHPNEWDFRPAVATALGEIGPAANTAIPALLDATTQSRDKLRRAARAALEKIRDLPPDQELRPVQLQREGEAPVPFHLDRRSQITWLATDGKTLNVVAGKEADGGFFQIDLASAIARQVLRFETEKVVSARATADSLSLLRLENDADGQHVIFERWSLGGGTQIERRTLTSLPPLKPKEKIQIAKVVWNPAVTLVAFSVKTEHPIPDKPAAVSLSNDTFAFGLDKAHDVEITEVAHYMMEPIGFSADDESLLLFGQYFDERWQWGIGKLDLSTQQFEAVEDSALSGSRAPRISPGGRYAVYDPTRSKQPCLPMLELSSGKLWSIKPSLPPDRITPPWRIAVAVSERYQKLAVATEATLDLYDLATGALEARHSLLDANGGQAAKPLRLETSHDQVVYAGLSTKLPYETQTLWVKTMPIRLER